MPSKKRDWAKEQAARLQARHDLGKADKRWRDMNGLSQQNCDDWSKAAGIPLHNSQIAYWERGSLDPKGEFWFAREAYNFAIAENDFPSGLKRTVKDRLKTAQPFLTHDGEVATALDFQAMFGNRQPIYTDYLEVKFKLTPQMAVNTSVYARTMFLGFCEEQMMSRQEGWKVMEPELKKILKTQTQRDHYKKILSGLEEWSFEELVERTQAGTLEKCPINEMYQKLTQKQLPSPRDVWTKGHTIKYSQLKPVR